MVVLAAMMVVDVFFLELLFLGEEGQGGYNKKMQYETVGENKEIYFF